MLQSENMRRKVHIIYILLILFESAPQYSAEEYLPILFWHSAGESCCEREFEKYSDVIRRHIHRDIYIKSVQIGYNNKTDRILSLITHPFDQINIACEAIKNDPKFANGYNGIGLSQGALMMRGLQQICPHSKMRNLVSLGGPHNGVYTYPHCSQISRFLCAAIRYQISLLIYKSPLQNLLTPATYWHDFVESKYTNKSTFLAIINNENEINKAYVERLQSLEKLVLVQYAKDQAVIPNESTFFGYRDENLQPVQLEQTDLFRKDKLGLRAMKENGQLVFVTHPSGHLAWDEEWFVEKIIPYLRSKVN